MACICRARWRSPEASIKAEYRDSWVYLLRVTWQKSTHWRRYREPPLSDLTANIWCFWLWYLRDGKSPAAGHTREGGKVRPCSLRAFLPFAFSSWPAVSRKAATCRADKMVSHGKVRRGRLPFTLSFIKWWHRCGTRVTNGRNNSIKE